MKFKDYADLDPVTQCLIVETLKRRLCIEFQKQDRSGVYGYTQRLCAYNSNKIEGSTLTEEHTASLFDTGTIKSNGEEIFPRERC